MLERKDIVKIGAFVIVGLVFIASAIGAIYVVFSPYKKNIVASSDTYTVKTSEGKLTLIYELGDLDLMGKKEYSVDDVNCNYTVIDYEGARKIGRVYHATIEKEIVYLPKQIKVQEGTEICYNAYTQEYANQDEVQVFPKWLLTVCELYCCVLLLVFVALVLALISLVTGVDIDFRRFRYR